MWMFKSNRKLTSPNVLAVENHNALLKLPLFIKKAMVRELTFITWVR